MKPRLIKTGRLIELPGPRVAVRATVWVCIGGGIQRWAWTPDHAHWRWQAAYNKPWRRALRWLRQLKKERA